MRNDVVFNGLLPSVRHCKAVIASDSTSKSQVSSFDDSMARSLCVILFIFFYTLFLVPEFLYFLVLIFNKIQWGLTPLLFHKKD
jgi:hypothetical protein